MSGEGLNEEPYAGKSIAEIVDDYGRVRGDLSEQYARDQLVGIIERRLAAQNADLRARLARVEEILAHWESEYIPTDSGWVEICATDLRAALAPQPAPGEGT